MVATSELDAVMDAGPTQSNISEKPLSDQGSQPYSGAERPWE